MTSTVLAVTGAAFLATVISAVSMTRILLGRSRRLQQFDRRLRRIAAPLTNPPEVLASDPEEVVILRSQKKRFPLWTAIEARYPLLHAPTAVPKALGLGVLGGAAAVGVLWFLRIPFGWWTVPAVTAAGAVVAWATLSWLQNRLLRDFEAKFPESVDHIVRLATTGLPVLGAVSSITEHAPHPVKPILEMFNDQLQAGIDPDEADASRVRTVPDSRTHHLHGRRAPSAPVRKQCLGRLRQPVPRAPGTSPGHVEGQRVHRPDPLYVARAGRLAGAATGDSELSVACID